MISSAAVTVCESTVHIYLMEKCHKNIHSCARFWASYKHTARCTLVQALRLCTGRTAHRGSRGIDLPFHDHGTRRRWGVSVTLRPLFTLGKDPVPMVQQAGWAPGPVWTGAENLALTGIRSPDSLALSQSLYQLRYPTHQLSRLQPYFGLRTLTVPLSCRGVCILFIIYTASNILINSKTADDGQFGKKIILKVIYYRHIQLNSVVTSWKGLDFLCWYKRVLF